MSTSERAKIKRQAIKEYLSKRGKIAGRAGRGDSKRKGAAARWEQYPEHRANTDANPVLDSLVYENTH